MKRLEKSVVQLKNFEFGGTLSSLESLYGKIQHLRFYFEANGKETQVLAEQMNALAWELKSRMECDKEVQWIWTFEWMKTKLLRKLNSVIYPHSEVINCYSSALNQDILKLEEQTILPTMPLEYISSSKLFYAFK